MRHFLVAWRWPLLACAIVLTAWSVRATWAQHAAFVEATALEQRQQTADAIDQYRWTLRWYTPWGPDWTAAAEALDRIARTSQAENPERAMAALDALRSGLIAGRHLWQPRADLVADVNQRMPPLLVRVAERGGDKRDKAKLLAQFTADYARPVGVSPLTSLAVSGGFVLWLVGLLLLARKGLDADARLTRGGWKWLAMAVSGFTIWALAMWLG